MFDWREIYSAAGVELVSHFSTSESQYNLTGAEGREMESACLHESFRVLPEVDGLNCVVHCGQKPSGVISVRGNKVHFFGVRCHPSMATSTESPWAGLAALQADYCACC